MNKESIIFFLSLIFNPCVKEGRFVNIDKQKNRLYQEINSLKDNCLKILKFCAVCYKIRAKE